MKYKSILPLTTQKKAKTAFKSKEDYESKLEKIQKDLIGIQREIHLSGKKVIVLFEGPDASGKGGVIKRLTTNLDPRGVQVHSIGKPTPLELEEFYMERFWRKLPSPGKISIFDRSWYGRILVERVEGFATPPSWKRAYVEINNFEKMLIANGFIILKYFLDVTYEEQGARFIERKKDPFKAWKLTEDDFRNRKKWNQYHLAFKDMLKKTHTTHSPWIAVPADSKWYARVLILKNILTRLKTKI